MVKRVFFISIFLLTLIFLGRLLAPSWYRFLAVDQPVQDAQVLLVEGWVSESTLKNAAQTFLDGNYSKVIVASILFPNEYGLNSTGTLVFNIHQKAKYDSLFIKAHSEKVGGAYAHMMVMVNDDTVGETSTTEQVQKYAFPIHDHLDSIQQIKITFTNDFFDFAQHADRNLTLDSLFLDNHFIPNRTEDVYFDRGKNDGISTEKAYKSRAGSSADYLIELGVPSEAIYIIDAPRVEYNKTYTTAKAVAAWMEENDFQERRMNLISENVHSRRSWMLFKKAMPDNTKIGIISSSRFKNDDTNWWKNRGRRAYVISQTIKFWYAVLSYLFI
jgi:hypothetical protein